MMHYVALLCFAPRTTNALIKVGETTVQHIGLKVIRRKEYQGIATGNNGITTSSI